MDSAQSLYVFKKHNIYCHAGIVIHRMITVSIELVRKLVWLAPAAWRESTMAEHKFGDSTTIHYGTKPPWMSKKPTSP